MVRRLSGSTWESKSALINRLDAWKPRSLLVARDAEAPRMYDSFSVSSKSAGGEIGVISSGLGARTAAILMDRERRVLIGHDTWLTWVDIETITAVASCRLGGVFFDFLPVEREDEIVVLHELGALRADASGGVKWSVDTDVVENSCTDAKGNLILTVMGRPRVVVSMTSGAVSR